MTVPAGGLSAQFGFEDETTFGTAQTVARFLEFNSETIEQTRERIESSGLRPNRRVVREKQWQEARLGAAGDVVFDVNSQGFGKLLKHMMGEIATSQPNAGSNPTVYEHKATVGQIDGKSFTAQIARADNTGTVRAYTYAGGKIPKWEVTCDENGFLVLKITTDFQSESTAIALASASYAATAVPLTYKEGLIKAAGTELPAKKFSLMGDNKLKLDRYLMRGTESQKKKEQLEGEGIRDYTGTVDIEFTGLSEYERFVKAENFEVTAFFEGPLISGTYHNALEITLPAVRYDGKTPNVPGPTLIDVSIPFKVVDSGNASGPVQLVYRSTDTTP